jgi:taurine dioxygenase
MPADIHATADSSMAENGASIGVVPTGAALGAEIRGVDLSRPLTETALAAIEIAFNVHSVLRFRKQRLNAHQLTTFARNFGEPQVIPYLQHYAHPECPEIMLVTNIQENGQNIGHADAGRVWHSDMSFMPRPPRATMLYAVEVPEENGEPLGDTLFASAVAAYDALPDSTKDSLDGLQAVHRVSGRRKKTGTGAEDDPGRERHPDIAHPVVRTHPETGRKAIYVSDGECAGIVGMADTKAQPLLADLAKRIIRPEFQYRHKWQAGDFVIWDNCAVQHLAVHDYQWPHHRRLMHRVTVGQTVPK